MSFETWSHRDEHYGFAGFISDSCPSLGVFIFFNGRISREVISNITWWESGARDARKFLGGRTSVTTYIMAFIWDDIIFTTRSQWERGVDSSAKARVRLISFMRT